jgi:hypothetical protein
MSPPIVGTYTQEGRAPKELNFRPNYSIQYLNVSTFCHYIYRICCYLRKTLQTCAKIKNGIFVQTLGQTVMDRNSKRNAEKKDFLAERPTAHAQSAADSTLHEQWMRFHQSP